MANIAILGHGVVGGGVAQIILENSESLKKQAGCDINLKYILDLRDFSHLPYAELFTNDYSQIINDEAIDIIVEVMGGLNPAYEFVLAALNKGINVVTSNKELVAVKGDELLAAAKEHNCNFMFEASVGGGIPIIRPLNTCLAANNISSIVGILNGTTNYILTKMANEGVDFDLALKEAQELGYAEKNPSADIDGIDTCRKICILANIMTGVKVDPDSICVTGITALTPEHTRAAKVYGGSVKLIGQAVMVGDKAAICVRPFVVADKHNLSRIDDVFNGIEVEGDSIGKVAFIGRGAGKLPTASAVVADIIDCAKAKGSKYNVLWCCKESILVKEDVLKRNWLVKAKGTAPNSLTEIEKGLYSSDLLTEKELYAAIEGMDVEFALPVLS